MSKGEPTNFPCATYDANGNAWTGGTNGEVYKWDGRTLDSTVKVGGAIHTIRFADGKLLAGGKSQKIYEIADGSAKEVVGDVGSLVRSIDSHNGSYIIGTRDGTIQDGNGNIWMRSHSDGEVWGAAQLGDDKFATTADDNKLIFWDLSGKSAEVYKITDETRKAPRGGASSLTDLPDAQCGRAVAIHGDHLVIGCNDGTVRVRSVGNPSTDIKTFQDSQEWIEVIAFSPDGAHVAVGSHDNNIYVYGTEDWSLKSKLTAHNSYINCLDWSSDSKYIRSNCGAYELLFFDVEKGEQEQNGPSLLKDADWATQTTHFGWYVDGIFPKGTDGTHINGVNWSNDRTLIACGDDYGLVQLFRSPAREGCHPISLRGHSEHVVRVVFVGDNLVSVGGQDKTVMFWTKK